MPVNERDEEIEALETERAELRKNYEDDKVSEKDFNKAMSKLDFRVSQIQEAMEKDRNPEQEKGRKVERKHDLFND